jgi:predicted glycosyltransferase
MRILVEATHPAHVHFFRNAIEEFKSRGHTVAVTSREKDVTLELLDALGIEHTPLSKAGKGKFSLLFEMFLRDVRLLKYCLKFKPDVLIAISGVFAAHAGFVIRKPVLVWDDTEHQKISHTLTYPFVRQVFSPDCYKKVLGSKQSFYAGTHELAYMHPNRFSPDKEIVKSLSVDPESKYCIIRFVSWQAHHDVGQSGFADNEKLNFVEKIAEFATPYITSEGKLPAEFEKYRLPVPAHQIHHLMAFSSLYVGEGATMAAESFILGVPAVYINTLGAGTIDMFAKYGLLKQTADTQQALEWSVKWLKDERCKEKCQAAREKLLADKIDVTDFIVEAVEQAGKG